MKHNWKSKPLGIAVVDQTIDGGLAIHHVTVNEDPVSLSGIWYFPNPRVEDVAPRLAHWIVSGTRDGMEQVEKLRGEQIRNADLAGLVAACQEAQEDLEARWQQAKVDEPVTRKNLTPLGAPTWPVITEDGQAAEFLNRVGIVASAGGQYSQLDDILALAKLTQYILESWENLETERRSRGYLNDGDEDRERRLFPVAWAEVNTPWWPREAV
jgi:hypothetical protein